MNRLATLLALGLLATAAACGSDDDHEEHATPEEDACEHMIEGPSQPVTATDDMAADAPDFGEHHTRFDITLVEDGSGMYGGYLDLVVEEEGETMLFTSAAVPVTLWDGSGNQVAAEATSDEVAACAEVSASSTYDLGVGTYLASFGPTAESSVSVVVVAEEHEHEE